MPSSVQLYSQAITDFKKLQGQLNEKQAKIGAESKADTFAELGSDLNSVQSFKLSIERSKRYVASIQDAQRRNDAQFSAIQQVIDLAQQFKQNLTIENSAATSGTNNLNQQANSILDSIRGALNSKDGANFLFGGSKTTTEPVTNLTYATSMDSTTPTANYYTGDDFKQAVDVSSSLRVEYGVTASDDAFKNLIGAINLAKTAESTNGNYTDTGTLLNSAIEDLISLQARIGDNARIFDSSLDYNTKAKTTFEQKYSEVNEPDIVQLTIETSQLQATLEASFSAFSRISQLSLINFL